ncbi:hypothetical protein [uncultured Lutibacter sp.]|uniref:hypothetical protein n=1 Tax=uncultured Lutibacter sp. TaxID=437739 RepID=UPI00262270EA|nr:hypothetical protein [uncultured Lutibacter sp.]
MKKYKYLIASSVLIILMILIFIPRPSEKIYVLYDKNEIECDSNIVRQNWEKDSYLICDSFIFINFTKKTEKSSRIMDLSKINKFKIISKKELLKRFSNDIINRDKYDFDLLDRDKEFDFNLILKDTIINKIEIIPVEQIVVFNDYIEYELN